MILYIGANYETIGDALIQLVDFHITIQFDSFNFYFLKILACHLVFLGSETWHFSNKGSELLSYRFEFIIRSFCMVYVTLNYWYI